MQIDMNYKFLTLDNKEQRETEFEKDKNDKLKRDKFGKPIPILGSAFTLRSACLAVLIRPPIDTDDRTGKPVEVSVEHNFMLTELAREIYKSNGLIDLTVEEIKLLKGFIHKRYNQDPLIDAQAQEILDPTDADKKKTKKT